MGIANRRRNDTELAENYWYFENKYSYASNDDVSANDGSHIRRWFHNIIIIYYNNYHCVTNAYSIQYSNMLYRFVA